MRGFLTWAVPDEQAQCRCSGPGVPRELSGSSLWSFSFLTSVFSVGARLPLPGGTGLPWPGCTSVGRSRRSTRSSGVASTGSCPGCRSGYPRCTPSGRARFFGSFIYGSSGAEWPGSGPTADPGPTRTARDCCRGMGPLAWGGASTPDIPQRSPLRSTHAGTRIAA